MLSNKHHHKRDELTVSTFTIEHISPDIGNEVSSMLGNLLPLVQKLNEKAANLDLCDKIQYYDKSDFKTIQTFLKHNREKSKWHKPDINNRTKLMAKICYKEIWQL